MNNVGRKARDITALLDAADAIEDVLAHAKVGEALTEPQRRVALRALRALSALEFDRYVQEEGLEVPTPPEPGHAAASYQLTTVCAWKSSPDCKGHISGPPQGTAPVSHGLCSVCAPLVWVCP